MVGNHHRKKKEERNVVGDHHKLWIVKKKKPKIREEIDMYSGKFVFLYCMWF